MPLIQVSICVLDSVIVLTVIAIGTGWHPICLMKYPAEMGHIAETTLHRDFGNTQMLI